MSLMPSLKSAACVLALMFTASAAQAVSIGFNVASDRQAMASDEIAGVVAQANWNQCPGSGNTAHITGPTAAAVVDNAGNTLPTVTVIFDGAKANETYYSNNSFVNLGDKHMLTGWLDSGYANTYGGDNAHISVAGLPASFTEHGYDIYVYFRGSGTIQLNPTSSSSTPAYYFTAGSSSVYQQATSTNSASPTPGNYVVFTHQTAASFKVSDWAPGLAGIQIVAVPEPAALALLGLGMTAMIRRRRTA